MKPSDNVFIKSPFENLLSLLNVLPQGHEKALKQALYNALALLFLALSCAAAVLLFYILEPFLKPLIWALLIGSVLHPFKRSIENNFQSWLQLVESSSQPLLFAVLMIPVHVIDETSEKIGNTLRRYIEWLIALCIGLLVVFLCYNYVPQQIFSAIFYIWDWNCSILSWFLTSMTAAKFGTILLCYIGILSQHHHWSHRHFLLSLTSHFVWFSAALFLARTIGYLTIPLFVFFATVLILGFGFEVLHMRKTSGCNTFASALSLALLGNSTKQHCDIPKNEGPTVSLEKADVDKNGSESESSSGTFKPPGLRASSSRKSDPELYGRRTKAEEMRLPLDNVAEESSTYIYAVIWACGLVLIWRNAWVAHLLPFPISVYVIKRIGFYFGIWSIVAFHLELVQLGALEWIKTRESVIFPAPIRGIHKVCLQLRVSLLKVLRESISPFASTLVIVSLVLFIFCFLTFLLLKIYTEGIHLITIGAGIINSTVVHNPEFLQLLPEGWSDKVESMLNNAYVYGREGISKQLRSALKDVEPTKVAELERHVLEFWDRVYQAWLMTALEAPSVGPKVPASAILLSWQSCLETIQKTPDILNMKLVTEFLKENLETLLSLLDSLWALLKGNVSLLFHFLFAVFSVLLGGGSAVVNCLVSGIVFFTALFYLLSSSQDLYKPVDILSNFSPINGNKVGVAFEAAVNGVFKASFKMALFYGLWTWLIHNIFQVRIIYLPSVLAAILGAVPFLGAYWASMPAVLELWLAQGQGVLAVALLVFQCLPMSFVDTAIYMEIRGGGHPYMTGLAIAGGVFCMGIQGAILGPLLLCCLLVALNMSSNLMKESPGTPNLAALSMRQFRRGRSNRRTVTTNASHQDNELMKSHA